MKSKHGLALLAIVCMTVACTENTLQHSYGHVSSAGWARTDTLRFPLPSVTATGLYDFHVGVRYNNDFPYEGIWMVMDMQLTHPLLSQRDTFFLPLNDADGMPLGHGIGLLQYEIPLHQLSLHEGQTGTISLYHIMSRETLPYIHDIGIRISH